MVVTKNNNGAQALTGIQSVSNEAEIDIIAPFTANVRIQGVADLLFHAWNNEAVEEKGKAPRGSTVKKTDNIESYIYRGPKDEICLPGRYLQRAVIEAARFHHDPRSVRKMALDLAKASVTVTPLLTPVLVKGKSVKDWDYLDRQRVVVQRSAITRSRPAFREGWVAEFEVMSLLPEYVTPAFLHRLVTDAGKFIGLGDFRPTYGRFVITNWQIV